MPAFRLAEFQQQIDHLLQSFALPTSFHQQLTQLFQRYEQPSFRYGVGVAAPPEPAYHLPVVMLEELENALVSMANNRPRAAFLLANECWSDPYYETRRVAAVVMGAAPLFDLAVFQDTFSQMLASTDQENQPLLFAYAWKRFRTEQPALVVEWISKWLSDDKFEIAFTAIQSLLDAGLLDFLPTIFRLVEKYVIAGDAIYQEEVLSLMDSLAMLSPLESAHFLSELTSHFYGEKRMKYFRALCRSFNQSQRAFINRAFMDPSAYYHEDDVIDEENSDG
ncbi:MAG: hypothetical protein V2J07_02355 [Anaerolineae bacterium]|jgi:hypothetical protein|nr:hypothetical protein [Anaerolineae bacterium]